MTAKVDYTPEEWAALVRSPVVAGMAIALADVGGPIGLVKESMATMRSVTEPAAEQPELVAAVKAELQQMAQARQNPAGDFKPEGEQAGEQVLGELQRVGAILGAKATPEEAGAFRAWLQGAAKAAAEAAKEGGFMGFGGERVSEGEQRMLAQVERALAG